MLAAVARSRGDYRRGSFAHASALRQSSCGLFLRQFLAPRRRRWCSMAVCGNATKSLLLARKNERRATHPSSGIRFIHGTHVLRRFL